MKSKFTPTIPDTSVTFPAFRMYVNHRDKADPFNGGVVVFISENQCVVLHAPECSTRKVGEVVTNPIKIEHREWNPVCGEISIVLP